MIALYDPDTDAIRHEAEYRLCKRSAAYMTDRYGIIDDVQDFDADAGGGPGPGITPATGAAAATTPFRLWPDQIPLFDDLENERQVIILKARQLGISWVVCAHVLWLCVMNAGRVVMMFSKGQRESDELIRRISVLHARLPEWLRAKLPRLTVDKIRELKWSNGSRVQAMPATSDAGVSFTASVIVLDEAAKMQFGRQLYVAAKPTIDNGGQIVMLSSANGFGGFFHNIWRKAEQGLNGFKTVFLPWTARPDRDADWYARIVRDADDPALVPQEYPANPIEAFVASGRLRFNPKHIAAQHSHLREPLDPREWPASLFARKFWPGLRPFEIPRLDEIPGLSVYRPPVPGRKYLIGADVAEGKDPLGKRDSDYDAAPVVDADTWEEVACLHGRWEPDAYGDFLIAVSEAYHGAAIVVERNNQGHAVLNHFKHRRIPFDRVALGHDGWPGWATTPVTKPEGDTLLSAALRDGLVTVRTRAALYEMHVYCVLKNGSTGAPAGEHDDYVSGWRVILSYLRSRSAGPSDPEPAVGGDPSRMTGFLPTR